MQAKITMLLGALALTLGACGSDGLTPREGCEQINVELCGRLYACLTAAELAAAGLPAAEAACVTMSQTQDGCAAQTTANTCTGNQTYHPGEAATCVDQVAGLSCPQIRDTNLDIAVAAPACAKVCAI